MCKTVVIEVRQSVLWGLNFPNLTFSYNVSVCHAKTTRKLQHIHFKRTNFLHVCDFTECTRMIVKIPKFECLKKNLKTQYL